MPGRWTDEGEERGWRGYGDREQSRTRRGYDEGRSFDDDAGRFDGPGRDRVFGERDTGAGYNLRDQPPTYGGGYGGGFSGSGRTETRGGRPAWQDRDYQGASPAM